jgi:hypothetical protein
MLDERELALKPIVGESVGHNARVSSSPLVLQTTASDHKILRQVTIKHTTY